MPLSRPPRQLADIDDIPDRIEQKHLTVFSIVHDDLIEAAAHRHKWIDQSQSVNLFLAQPDTGCEGPRQPEPHMDRRASSTGLKNIHYLRTLGASSIEKSNENGKTSGRQSPSDGGYTAAEKAACSIEAMRNGEECGACQ